MTSSLTLASLRRVSKLLAASDPHLAAVYSRYGPPPLWDREPGFATLLHIILEQQVSLASARACFDKLGARLGHVSPETVLALDDSELREVGFSRQKAGYARNLATALLNKDLDLDGLTRVSDAEAKAELQKLKGVGEWTSDIYLLMVLLRPDVMPRGDIALHARGHPLRVHRARRRTSLSCWLSAGDLTGRWLLACSGIFTCQNEAGRFLVDVRYLNDVCGTCKL
jgi:DNA-3-methyladenine glycosylase II